MAKTIKEQAYDIWVESKGKIDLECLAMLVDATEDEISTWIFEGEWFKALESAEIIPYKKEIKKFETHVLPRLKDILQWLQSGMTEYSIADKLGISRATLIEYKSKYLTFQTLYTRAQDERNCLVMNKMFAKATGEKVSLKKQKLDKEGDIHTLTEEVYIPPDVNAADLYLRNNSKDYKSAKFETGNTLIQVNNYQLDDIKQQMLQLSKELNTLEVLEAVSVEGKG